MTPFHYFPNVNKRLQFRFDLPDDMNIKQFITVTMEATEAIIILMLIIIALLLMALNFRSIHVIVRYTTRYLTKNVLFIYGQ